MNTSMSTQSFSAVAHSEIVRSLAEEEAQEEQINPEELDIFASNVIKKWSEATRCAQCGFALWSKTCPCCED